MTSSLAAQSIDLAAGSYVVETETLIEGASTRGRPERLLLSSIAVQPGDAYAQFDPFPSGPAGEAHKQSEAAGTLQWLRASGFGEVRAFSHVTYTQYWRHAFDGDGHLRLDAGAPRSRKAFAPTEMLDFASRSRAALRFGLATQSEDDPAWNPMTEEPRSNWIATALLELRLPVFGSPPKTWTSVGGALAGAPILVASGTVVGGGSPLFAVATTAGYYLIWLALPSARVVRRGLADRVAARMNVERKPEDDV